MGILGKMHSFKFKLILFLILISCAVLLLQIFISSYFINNIITQKSMVFFRESIQQIGKRMDFQVNRRENFMHSIAQNQVIKNNLEDLNNLNSDYQMNINYIIREALKLKQSDGGAVNDIYIFTTQGIPINCYYSEAVLDIDTYSELILHNSMYSQKDNIIWSDYNPELLTISAYAPIFEGNGKLGLLKARFTKNFFSEIIDEASQSESVKILVVDQNSNIIYSKDNSLINKSSLSFNKPSNLVFEYPMSYGGWRVKGIIPKSEIANQILQINSLFLIIYVIAFCIIIVLVSVFISKLLLPLKKIMKGMECIQNGNLSVILEHGTKDEFGFIIRNFNYMVEHIKLLLSTVYKQQTYYRKTAMEALQAKLNPHFLYNTLDAIYWMLIMKDQTETAKIVMALSDILRYSISHENEFVAVEEDINQLENYLKIQKVRFGEKLEYSVTVDKDILELKIPKLLLQPLVENSIKHGFKEMKYKGIINVSGFIRKEAIIFEVSDNGTGMSEKAIGDIFRQSEDQARNRGIGIKMVHDRIRYIYGEAYGITISSIQGAGTQITVQLGKKVEFNIQDQRIENEEVDKYA